MCREDTIVRFTVRSTHIASGFYRGFVFFGTVALMAAAVAQAQQIQSQQISVSQTSTVWKRVAGTSINAGLAGAASGPVTSIWYAPGTLLAQTSSGRIFETSDRSEERRVGKGCRPSRASSL